MAVASRLSFLTIMLCVGFVAVPAAEPPPAVFHVAREGNDAWSGRRMAPNATATDGPFATLARARDAIRALKAAGSVPPGGAGVEIGPGDYELAATVEFGPEDSGSADAPIEYRPRPGARVRLLGGRTVTAWREVVDPAVLGRLEQGGIGKVLQADLEELALADLGEMKAGPRWSYSEPGLELFFRDRPMPLARWPNEGFVTMVEVLGKTRADDRDRSICSEGVFRYQGDRPERWAGCSDIMLHGFWARDWADQRLKVQSIDTEAKVITLEPEPLHQFGFKTGHWYYAYNLLPELDRPGEWYLDRQSRLLYFWPPAPVEDGDVAVSVLPSIVVAKNASFVTLRGITLEVCRGTAVQVDGGEGIRLIGCTIRNTGDWGARISGRGHAVVGCDISDTGGGGISLEGGNRASLTPGRLVVDNCHLTRFGRWNPILHPGVRINGVGNRLTHSLLHDAPHCAVMWGGNDHLFEHNEFHSLVKIANDAGVMYAGYDPAARGNMIRHNYFHDVYGFEGRGCVGVYLDDCFCSATIFGNIFQRVPNAAFIGGGHDNVVENNIFVDCEPAVHVDARMLGSHAAQRPIMKQRLEQFPYRDEPWRSRYPELLTYLEGNYAQPRNNRIVRNICWGGVWDRIAPDAKPGVVQEANLIDVDPRFISGARFPFDMQPDSPAWKLGFKRIPTEEIGLYRSQDRASWPVVHEAEGQPPEKSQSLMERAIRWGRPLLMRRSSTWAIAASLGAAWLVAFMPLVRRMPAFVSLPSMPLRLVLGFIALLAASHALSFEVMMPRRRVVWPATACLAVMIEIAAAVCLWPRHRGRRPPGQPVTTAPAAPPPSRRGNPIGR